MFINVLLIFLLLPFFWIQSETPPPIIIEPVEVVEIIQEPYHINFCDTIDRWENAGVELAYGNYHGVQINGDNVTFPFNGYYDSYQWCYSEYDYVTPANVEYVVCKVYQSNNTCENINEFKTEVNN